MGSNHNDIPAENFLFLMKDIFTEFSALFGKMSGYFNPLSPELNPIRYLLALL